MDKPAIARVMHAIPRRVRLRAPALAGHRDACGRVAEQLAQEPGCETVSVRPLTGSVIIEGRGGKLDPESLRVRLDAIVAAERDQAGLPLTARQPEQHPGPTRVARAVTHAFAAINADVRDAMDNRADLGTILPVIFASAGLAELAITRKMPVPAWFNLLWWSIRAFMTFNEGAVGEEAQKSKANQQADDGEMPKDCDNGSGNGGA
jgi:hypothetical protein